MILLLLNFKVRAQNPSVIQPQRLAVTFSKTTNLIFPYPIKSVDKGSRDLLAQVAGGVENILQVKAAKQGFAETNLTVVTGDGRLYSFLVDYADNPALLNIRLDDNIHSLQPDALFELNSDNEARVHDLAEQILLKKPLLKGPEDEASDIRMALSGIYIREDRLYLQLALENNSQINYDISQLRFYIRDKSQAKRTAVQEQELQPLQYAGNTEVIRGNSAQSIVAVLPKFTIPDKKLLYIGLMEKNGGRQLRLEIKNKVLMGASLVSSR
ncbi:conjugative transposon protein TraN [Mucilaginibacter sp. UC70_90]